MLSVRAILFLLDLRKHVVGAGYDDHAKEQNQAVLDEVEVHRVASA